LLAETEERDKWDVYITENLYGFFMPIEVFVKSKEGEFCLQVVFPPAV
jgi:hypothetical protein